MRSGASTIPPVPAADPEITALIAAMPVKCSSRIASVNKAAAAVPVAAPRRAMARYSAGATGSTARKTEATTRTDEKRKVPGNRTALMPR